jgi:hypothetical protein
MQIACFYYMHVKKNFNCENGGKGHKWESEQSQEKWYRGFPMTELITPNKWWY